MNIFWIEPSLMQCATSMCNQHVVKMTLEYAQMLSNAHHTHPSKYRKEVYLPTHVTHPCSRWVYSSAKNYQALYALWVYVAAEYSLRYGRIHRSWADLGELLRHCPLDRGNLTVPPTVTHTPIERTTWGQVVTAYRNYYIKKVSADPRTFVWKKGRPAPEWLTCWL